MNKEIGLIGLGKMGSNIASKLSDNGYKVHGFDVDESKQSKPELKDIESHTDIEELIDSLNRNRVIWLSVPSGNPVDQTINELKPLLDPGDIVIDAGNSNYKNSIRRHAELSEHGIKMLDAGCSGGPGGVMDGLAIMIGGDKETYEETQKIFKTLGHEDGVAYLGEPGSGHYVKMVHNAVEYGIMQCLGEGYQLIEEGPINDVDLADVSRVWNNGAVIESRLVELTNNIFENQTDLSEVRGSVPDSGMGRWSVKEAVDSGVPLNAISHSLFARYRSRVGDEATFADKVIAMLRNEFGGHEVEKKED